MLPPSTYLDLISPGANTEPASRQEQTRLYGSTVGKFQDVSLRLSCVPHLDGVVVGAGEPGVRAGRGGGQRPNVIRVSFANLNFVRFAAYSSGYCYCYCFVVVLMMSVLWLLLLFLILRCGSVKCCCCPPPSPCWWVLLVLTCT